MSTRCSENSQRQKRKKFSQYIHFLRDIGTFLDKRLIMIELSCPIFWWLLWDIAPKNLGHVHCQQLRNKLKMGHAHYQ